jgi:alkylated DNA repair protein (DNA oxidative demethylase)
MTMTETLNLFADADQDRTWCEELCPGARVLRRFALPYTNEIHSALCDIVSQAPYRQMTTPGGFRMSVAMTNCGSYGWVTDRSGYRYDGLDPESGKHWPAMPPVFLELAQHAAAQANFLRFEPDACLINCYEPDARLSLHQDKNERDFAQPIVSVSLGVAATFLFGSLQRTDKPLRIALAHGDVVVWGGPARLRYHGVLPLKADAHSFAGARRINLTFRRVM